MATKIYQVIDPIKVGGKKNMPGETVELEVVEAELLRADGVIGDEVKSNVPQEPVDAAERIAAVVDAISRLDAEIDANWTKDGRPQIPALNLITGWLVTGKDRDAAWAQINAAK